MVCDRESAMPTFVYWYAVFLMGSAVGAPAGSSFANGFAVVGGLLGGIAISGWIAEQLPSNRRASALDSENSLIRATTMPVPGLGRIRFASASSSVYALETTAAEHDILGAFSLPKGMYEFAMRKQIGKQASCSPIFAKIGALGVNETKPIFRNSP
jgi:hypothetical protein